MTVNLWAMVAVLGSLGAGPVYHEPATYTGEAIERAVASAYKDLRGRVYLPGGTYKITKTIRLNGLGPLLIEGASLGVQFPEWNHASSVKLEWWGPPNEPMIRLDTYGILLKNLFMDGRNIASHAVLLGNGPQFGTAMNRLEDMVLANVTQACFQAGEKASDGNAADSYFDRVVFVRAPAGFKSVNDQSVNNHFMGCSFADLERAFDIERGGAVTVVGGGAMHCDWVVRQLYSGHNCGAIHISSFKLENSGYKKRYMSLVDAQPPPGRDFVDAGMIRLTNVWMAGVNIQQNLPDIDAPLFRLGPGAQVIADGCMFKQGGDRGQWPFAYLTGVANGSAVLRARDCFWMGDLSPRSFVTTGDVRVQIDFPATPNGKRTDSVSIGSR